MSNPFFRNEMVIYRVLGRYGGFFNAHSDHMCIQKGQHTGRLIRGNVSSRSSRQNESDRSRSNNNTFDAAVQQLYGEGDGPNGGADRIDGHEAGAVNSPARKGYKYESYMSSSLNRIGNAKQSSAVTVKVCRQRRLRD